MKIETIKDLEEVAEEMNGLLGPSVRSEASLFQAYIKQWRARILNVLKDEDGSV